MQALSMWHDEAKRKGYFTTLLSTDVEGGFDKVKATELIHTDLDKAYLPWIQNWSQNRRVQFRINKRKDLKEYVINNSIPQGSPLSPYLFGAHVHSIMEPNFKSTSESTSTT